jgi:hypothetical protein
MTPLVTTSSGSSAGSTTGSGASTGTSGTTSTGATTTGGTTTAGTSGTGTSTSSGTTGTSSGGTTGSSTSLCTWVGDVCGVNSCSGVSRGTACVVDGGLGHCYGRVCRGGLDLQNDPNNCGDYGVVCPSGVPCKQDSCVAFPFGIDCTNGGGCPAGTTCKGFGCVPSDCVGAPDDLACATPGADGFCCTGQCMGYPPRDDPNNCGGCGTVCADGTTCYREQCVLAAVCTANDNSNLCALDSGVAGSCCLGSCVDSLSDPAHCGLCDFACPVGASCQSGLCSTEGTANSCDAGCPLGRTCSFGICYLSTCGANDDGLFCLFPDGGGGSYFRCCGSQCVDFSSTTDPANCGGCGNACPAGVACLGGLCAVASVCTANGDGCVGTDGGTAWTGFCCAGACQSHLDSSGCGGCGLGCPNGVACTSITDFDACTDDAGSLASCQRDTDCPDGRVCAPAAAFLVPGGNAGACVPPLCDAGAIYCAVPKADGGLAVGLCCGSICADPASDNANCGHCGATCAPGLSCSQLFTFSVPICLDPSMTTSCGTQFPCPTASFCEGASCVAPTCGGGMEGQLCSFGPQLFGFCCGGQCIDINADPGNCRGCGNSCPGGSTGFCTSSGCVASSAPQDCLQSCGPGTICAQTQCVDSVCGGLFRQYCLAQDGSVGACCPFGACATLSTDPQNCGACGVVCPPGASCQNGLCNGLAECAAGHSGSYCNLDAGVSFLCCPGLGCADTASDPQNCGACGVACTTGLGCDGGICG